MKKIASVKKHMVRPYVKKQGGVVDDAAAQLSSQEDFKSGYFAFTSLKFRPEDGLLYCGNTNFGNDLLRTFNPSTGEFKSLGYQNFAEEFEIKIHRSLELGDDGMFYGATSCLHGPEKRLEGPGGKVFRYDPEKGEYKLLCIPKEHDYIQTISLDSKRGMVYGFTYPVFEFFAYSIDKNEVVYRQFMDSISHISAIDDNGGYWGTWSYLHKLFRYDPVENKVEFFDHGFPEKGGNMMYRNAGPIDCMVNGGDGFMYVATDMGSLYKLNPETAEVEFLGKPFSSTRLPGLALGDDGLLYLSGGDDDNCQLAIYDREMKRFETLGTIADEEGDKCYRTHDIEIVGNKIYVGETDHPTRTDYLWECVIN
jgi:outer membrane protein assembly factor BamB